MNYILWIQDLLDTTSDSYKDVYDPERELLGLDIGTGASCIYPLLGCSQRPNWRFAGTGRLLNATLGEAWLNLLDIDDKSIQFAKQNVQENGLQSRIKLLQTQPADSLLPLDKMKLEK